MGGSGTEQDNQSNLDGPYWDLYTLGTVILIAYHRCGPEREPVIARYHILSKKYECPRCGAVHSATLDISDRPVSAPEEDHYVSFGDRSRTSQPYL